MTSQLIFFGTSEFAVPSLEALVHDDRFTVVAVVTQPDRPVGRHAVLTPPPVKIAAQRLGITDIRQPEKIHDETFATWLKHVGPDMDAMVIASYGKILPQWLLDLPKHGIVNVHPSLLPRWRGTSPIQTAIAAGDTTTGVTIMQIDAGLDHGGILAQTTAEILPSDTGETLHDRLAILGGELLVAVLPDYLAGRVSAIPQDDSLATFCKMLSREDGELDTQKTADELERRVRAFFPWPGTWLMADALRIKIHSARVGAADPSRQPGTRFCRQGIPCLSCAAGTVLELLSLQPEGKQPLSADAFIKGYERIWNSPTV